MRKILALLLLAITLSCQQSHPLQKEYPNSISVNLKNVSTIDRSDELVALSLVALPENFNSNAFVVVDGDNELSSQVTDKDGDGNHNEISFICDINAGDSKDITILYAYEGTKNREYTKRTQAEVSHKVDGEWVKREYMNGQFQNVDFLRVPPEHTDHSWFIRYEGPGWESDKVGYRFYLDWRNAVDIFGKKTSDMVLQNAGQDGFDSYHEMSDWGMDILKVGSSLGIGSIGMWIADSAQRVAKTDSITCQIVSNGDIQSIIKTNYFGWEVDNNKYNLSASLSINAGSRITKYDLKLDKNPLNLCTGIVKDDSAEVINSTDESSEWQFLATYGKQSLNKDNLGMAVLYKKSELDKLAEDNHNYAAVLTPTDGMLTYYFLAAWELEPDGIKDKESFIKYLDDTLNKLNNPLKVVIQ